MQKIEGRKINHGEAQIYFCRHAESFENIGNTRYDSPLTDEGVKQAKLLEGDFDLVIVSHLRRTQETLQYSNITYGKLYESLYFHERIFKDNKANMRLLSNDTEENDKQFSSRMQKFHDELELLCQTYKRILLIGHSYYFNCWYRQGCYPSLPNATIFQLS